MSHQNPKDHEIRFVKLSAYLFKHVLEPPGLPLNNILMQNDWTRQKHENVQLTHISIANYNNLVLRIAKSRV